MSKVVSAKCPECGARLKVDPSAENAKCEYCGAVSPIQTRRQIQMHIKQGTAQIRAIEVRKPATRLLLFVMLLPLMGILVTGIVTFVAATKSTSGTSIGQTFGTALSNINIQWHGDAQPILLDISGDTVSDPIGRIRRLEISTGAHTEHLAAYNPINGKQLWMSPSLGNVSEGHFLRIAMVDNIILVADSVGVLKAFDPMNGQIRWSATVGERVDRICGADPGIVRLETKDKRTVSVALATGQLTPTGKSDPKAQCLGAWSTDPANSNPWVTRIGGAFHRGEPLPKIPGMDVEYVFRQNATLTSIAVGKKSQGTRIPTAAAYDPTPHIARGKEKRVHHFHKKDTAAIWLTNIPAVNPLTVYEDGPEVGTIAMGRAIFPYRLQKSDGGWRISCLDLRNGRNLFDVAIANKKVDPGAIVSSSRFFYISSWTGLHVFDLTNGAERIVIAPR